MTKKRARQLANRIKRWGSIQNYKLAQRARRRPMVEK